MPMQVLIADEHALTRSGLKQDEYRGAAVEAGADGFVAKRQLTTALAPMLRRFFGST